MILLRIVLNRCSFMIYSLKANLEPAYKEVRICFLFPLEF